MEDLFVHHKFLDVRRNQILLLCYYQYYYFDPPAQSLFVCVWRNNFQCTDLTTICLLHNCILVPITYQRKVIKRPSPSRAEVFLNYAVTILGLVTLCSSPNGPREGTQAYTNRNPQLVSLFLKNASPAQGLVIWQSSFPLMLCGLHTDEVQATTEY